MYVDINKWNEWSKSFPSIITKINDITNNTDIITFLHDYFDKDNVDRITSILDNSEYHYEISEEPRSIWLRNSLISLMKHYPAFKDINHLLSIDFDGYLFTLSNITNNITINLRFRNNGTIFYFVKDNDDDDIAFYYTGEIHTSKSVNKSYKLEFLLSSLDVIIQE